MKKTINFILIILVVFVFALVYFIGFNPELLNVRSGDYASWMSFSGLIALSSMMLFLSYVLYQKSNIYPYLGGKMLTDEEQKETLKKSFGALINFGIAILVIFLIFAVASIGFIPHFFEGNEQVFMSKFVLFTVLGLTLGLFVFALSVQNWWNQVDPKRIVERQKIEEKVAHIEQKIGKKIGRLTLIERILQVKPVYTDQDVAIGHSYDGIEELDNPAPPWFMFLFYGTIVFAIVYFFIYIVGSGPTQIEEYEAELKAAKLEHEQYLLTAQDLVDENTVVYNSDPAFIAEGAKIFEEKCVVCHKEGGAGGIGPNLADKYWLHGGSIQDIFSTIKYGVTAKGMQSWKDLGAAKMDKLSSYVMSLQGTNPPNAQEPKGELWVEEGVDSTAVMDEDSILILE